MTQAHLDALELVGLAFIAIGAALYFHYPLLLASLGFFYVIVANTGKANNGDSP